LTFFYITVAFNSCNIIIFGGDNYSGDSIKVNVMLTLKDLKIGNHFSKYNDCSIEK